MLDMAGFIEGEAAFWSNGQEETAIRVGSYFGLFRATGLTHPKQARELSFIHTQRQLVHLLFRTKSVQPY
jgi:hypothetical protein